MPLDLGIGLLLGVFLHHLSGLPYAFCLVMGAIATLLPDVDYLYALLRTKTLPHSEHRDGLHYPLFFTLVVGGLGCMVNPYIGLIFALGALAHFVHDSIGVGWGIKWLFPFGRSSYMFLYKATFPTSKKLPKKLIYSWTDAQRTQEIKKYADPQWIRHMYFQLHPFGLVEYAVLIFGILFAIICS